MMDVRADARDRVEPESMDHVEGGTGSADITSPVRASVMTPQVTATRRIAPPIQPLRASSSRLMLRPISLGSQARPKTVTATNLATSSGLTKPVKRHPAIAVF